MTGAWRARACAAVLALVPAAALALRGASQDDAILAALKVVVATGAVAVVPGALVFLAWAPLSSPGLLEAFGFSVALSFGLIQALTIASVVGHVPVWAIGQGLAVASIVGAVALYRARQGDEHAWPRPADGDRWTIPLLVALAVLFYLKGSPFFSDEDQIHAAVVRRLAFIDRPAIDAIYHGPNTVYTHPFPGVHFLMALVTSLGGIDALFAYHKLRFFWVVAAITFVALGARRVFESPRLAGAATITAVLFVLNGTFADYPNINWAQLAPYSHPADVAMNVLLPATLVVAFYYLRASTPRERVFAFSASAALGVALAVTHVREVVQLLVYLGAFAIAVWLVRRDVGPVRQVAWLMAPIVIGTLLYIAFHRGVVTDVAGVNADSTRRLVAAATKNIGRLYKRPLPKATGNITSLVYGWNWLVLALGPVALVVFRRHALVLLLGASVLTYLLLVRFPLFTLPYVYLTYWEILMTPARNVTFFVYLLAGPLLYAGAVTLARIGQPIARIAATVVVGLVVSLAVVGGGPWLAQHLNVFFLPTIALFVLAFALLRRRGETWDGPVLPDDLPEPWPPRSWRVTFAVLLVIVTVGTWLPVASPASLTTVRSNMAPFPDSAPLFFTPRALMDDVACLDVRAGGLSLRDASQVLQPVRTAVRTCPPPYALVRWATRTLPPDSVLASSAFTVFGPPAYLPFRVVAWPAAFCINVVNPMALAPAYYGRLDRALKTHGTQPFFNEVESLEERVAFVRALGATHVLVDPMYHAALTRALGERPDVFRLLWNESGWAVFQVMAR